MTRASKMRRRHGLALMILIALCATMNPAPAAAQDKPVVLARLQGATITSDDLALRAYERHYLGDEPYQDYDLSKSLLDDIIVDSLVSLEAAKLDLSGDYSLRERIRRDELRAGLVAYQNATLLPNLDIDSTTIDSFYNANIARYTAPRDQRKIRQITVYKEGHKIPKTYVSYVDPLYEGWDPKRKIDSIYTRLANGEDFATLAGTHSEELKAKIDAGELGWLSRVSIVDSELVEPFLTLPLHQISKPIETSYAWVIAQVTAERRAGPAPIDMYIRDDIVRQLKEAKGRDAATALTDSLVAAGTVEYNESLLDAPDSLIDGGSVLAIVNHRDTLWGAGYTYLKNQSANTSVQATLPRERKLGLLQPSVRLLFLYGAMRDWGYLDDPEIAAMCERRRLRNAREKIVAQFTSSTYSPDSAEIARYYHDHITDYTPSRRHQVEIARFADRDSAQQALVAWQAGTSPSHARIQIVGPSDLPAPVWNKLAAVTPNSFVGPVSADGAYWCLHLTRIEPPKPLRTVQGSINATMRKERREKLKRDWVTTMSRRYGLVRYDDRLRTVFLPSRDDPRFASDSTSVEL